MARLQQLTESNTVLTQERDACVSQLAVLEQAKAVADADVRDLRLSLKSESTLRTELHLSSEADKKARSEELAVLKVWHPWSLAQPSLLCMAKQHLETSTGGAACQWLPSTCGHAEVPLYNTC